MDTKKISFGFSKIAKKPNILPSKAPKEENKVDLIKCLEGKEIKLVAEKQEAAPLIIQMQQNQKTSTALASLMKRRAVLLGEDDADVNVDESTAEAQSIAEVTANGEIPNLDQRAARELLAAAQDNGKEIENSEKLVLPAVKADELPLNGAKEATLDDYDSIPIQQFGLAMLRGMGWVDPPPKKKGSAPVDEAPFLRPKGMGLGADKALKPRALLVQPEKNEVLEIKRQAYVRILGGKQKDQYGQIEGFDDHAGRVIVKMAIGGTKEAFNEFLCQPVSLKEYSQYGKCINSAKYEEFKKHENEHGQIIIKQEKSTERNSVKTERKERHREDESRFDRSKQEERKTYKTEHRSSKTDERRRESRSHKEERNSSYHRNNKEDLSTFKDYKDERSAFHSKREERKPYKTEERGVNDISSSSSRYLERGQETIGKSSSRRRQQSSSDEADDTAESTESDSDSAYERKNIKKSSSSSTRKSKKRKSKKSKSKTHRLRRSSDSCSSEHSNGSADDRAQRSRHPSKHKKKTKKSKHVRSRTRSRSREGRGR